MFDDNAYTSVQTHVVGDVSVGSALTNRNEPELHICDRRVDHHLLDQHGDHVLLNVQDRVRDKDTVQVLSLEQREIRVFRADDREEIP